MKNQNKVVILGTAEFSRNVKQIEFMSACDIYEFDIDHMLQKVTSYCVIEKEDQNQDYRHSQNSSFLKTLLINLKIGIV